MTIKVFDRTVEALSKSLDLRAQKQVVISSNVANSDTPGYQAQTLDFEGALAKALTVNKSPSDGSSSSDESSIDAINDINGEIYNQINNVVREDGNTVDRESEMISMSENQLLYTAAVDLVKKKLALIKYSITDGGGH